MSWAGECEGAAEKENRGTDWARWVDEMKTVKCISRTVKKKEKKKKYPGWSPSQVSESHVRSCLATVMKSLCRQAALFYSCTLRAVTRPD